MASEAQVGEMVLESWRLLRELLYTGAMTLKNKTIIMPSPELMIRAVQDIAKLQPPKVRKITNVDNFRLKATTHKPDGG